MVWLYALMENKWKQTRLFFFDSSTHSNPSIIPGSEHGFRDLRRLESLSTIPDPELECKLFLDKFKEKKGEELVGEIMEWVSEIHSFDDPKLDFMPTAMAMQCRKLQQSIHEKKLLEHGRSEHVKMMTPKMNEINKAHGEIMQKLLEGKDHDQGFVWKKKSLDEWKQKKTDALNYTLEKHNQLVNDADHGIKSQLEKLILEEKRLVGNDDGNMMDLSDEFTKEIEDMMGGLALEDPSLQQTLDYDPEMEISPSEVVETPSEVVETPSKVVEVPGDVDGDSKMAQDDKGDGSMESPSCEDQALNHIKNMEDGPTKQALLALLEATATKAHHCIKTCM